MQANEETEQTTTYDHVIKYTGLFGGIQGVNLLAAIVRNKLVAVILGPSGLGLISLYNTAMTLLSNATNFGISFSAVRHVSELSEKEDKAELLRFIQVVRSWSIATALLGILVCCLFSPVLSWYCFETWEQWLPFFLLSPVVGLLALSGGELAILKGTRRLRHVGMQSLINSLCTLVISVPIYYVLGESGIVLSLILMALATLLTTMYFSCRSYPFRCSLFSREYLVEGMDMVRLGVAFILAGILGSGVEFVIRAYMMHAGSIEDVGMYNAGYAVTVTYASMVFVAMETDFFPRLSAVNQDIKRSNEVVNKQIEASVLLISPLLIAFLVFLPILLPLLYASSFLPVIGMAQCAVFSMFLRAVALPISYMSLAKGRSAVYLFTEALYDVCVVAFIIAGYSWWGLRGTGIALSVAAVVDLLLVWGTTRVLYKFRLHGKALRMLGIHMPFAIAAFVVTHLTDGWAYWLLGCACILFSSAISFYILSKETTLLSKLMQKIKRKIK